MSNLLKSILVLILVLVILWLGQLPYFQKIGGGLYTSVESWVKGLWQSGVNFWNQHILKRVSTEVEKRQEIVKKEINSQTQQVGQTIWQKIKDYFWGLFGQKQAVPK